MNFFFIFFFKYKTANCINFEWVSILMEYLNVGDQLRLPCKKYNLVSTTALKYKGCPNENETTIIDT